MAEDEDRPRDATAGAADASWDELWADHPWSQITIPNDCRELSGDIAAYHREMRRGYGRAFGTNRPLGLPALLIAAALVLAAAIAAMLTAIAPRPNGTLQPTSHLATTSVAAGQVGGLLPAATLSDATGRLTASRNLRPGLVVLLPLHCDCAPLLNSLAAQTIAAGVPMDVVAPARVGSDADADSLPGQLDTSRVSVLYDANQELAKGMAARGLTVVTVRSDGLVAGIARNVGADDTQPAAMLRAMTTSGQVTG